MKYDYTAHLGGNFGDFRADLVAKAALKVYCTHFIGEGTRPFINYTKNKSYKRSKYGVLFHHVDFAALPKNFATVSPLVILEAIAGKLIRNARRRKNPPAWSTVSLELVQAKLMARLRLTSALDFIGPRLFDTARFPGRSAIKQFHDALANAAALPPPER